MKVLTIVLALIALFFFLFITIEAIGRLSSFDPVKKFYDSQQRKHDRRLKRIMKKRGKS